ncbi:DNA recombination protein RmuC [Crocosphaera watsonii WH 0402]|uniref:DNA recombination protein RmuC n=2 Tax=Crocosphaera watsonii TaxID=263511 RepID=T2JWR1_CROWT|nr:hypothetical protein CWATWH0005_4348 [Crocosphaera watsonii WH 0005]CCQ69509.1 DNA recombination protein RmuC [Crocosphaera watsonii WH 0402]
MSTIHHLLSTNISSTRVLSKKCLGLILLKPDAIIRAIAFLSILVISCQNF